MKANRLFIACVATVALVACGGGTELTATLTGAAEKPTAVTTNASGSAKVTIDGSKLSVSGSFTGLSSNATGAHIHGPVKADGTGDVFCNLKVPSGTSGPIEDTADANACGDKELTEAQIADFEGGKMYVNIHSANFGGGEIRGDLSKKD
jgi:hypothetical protein